MDKIVFGIEKNKVTHLRTSGATLNSPKIKFLCRLSMPCKLILSCRDCYLRRREYFCFTGSLFLKKHDINLLVPISWPQEFGKNEDPWEIFKQILPKISPKLSKIAGKHIRVFAIGEKGTPHIHLLIAKDRLEILRKFIKFLKVRKNLIHSTPVLEPLQVLGYLYDRNYVPIFRSPQRPRRKRLLSGSRGMSFGYLNKRQWREYAKELQKNESFCQPLSIIKLKLNDTNNLNKFTPPLGI